MDTRRPSRTRVPTLQVAAVVVAAMLLVWAGIALVARVALTLEMPAGALRSISAQQRTDYRFALPYVVAPVRYVDEGIVFYSVVLCDPSPLGTCRQLQ